MSTQPDPKSSPAEESLGISPGGYSKTRSWLRVYFNLDDDNDRSAEPSSTPRGG
jgi:hypothetical protein